jgi:hypothetical protein
MHEIVIPVMVMGIVGASFLFIGWLVWMVSRTRRERQQSELQMRAQMLEKFGSSDEFAAFLQTDAGKKFLDRGSSKVVKNSRARVASSLSWGAVVFMFGLAMFVMGLLQSDSELIAPGTIFTAIGIGLAITAYIYHRIAPDAPRSED